MMRKKRRKKRMKSKFLIKQQEMIRNWYSAHIVEFCSSLKFIMKIRNAFRFVTVFLITMFCTATTVFAEETAATTTSIWTNVFNAISSIYSNLVLLATIIAATAAVIALLIRMISKNQRAVEEANSWLKRIAISYVLINAIGLLATFLEDLLSDTAAPGTTVDDGIQTTPGFN